MLENRLRKRHKHLRKWARRHDVSCYRLYDRDIPELPLAIDLYTVESGDRHLCIAHYQRDSDRDGPPAGWLDAMAEAATRVLEATGEAPVSAHVRQRRRQRGAAQYQRSGAGRAGLIVREGGHRFAVELDAYLDTGLFLDHRPLRARIEREAAGRSVLNLFCYTGAITVYAAKGGASSSLSVDLSNRYLSWAEDNLALNRIDSGRHRLLRADVFEYLRDPGRAGFDLAVLDPPTFSNSKRMEGVLDIQRDHPGLIRQTLALMRPGGVLYFSTNSRRFKFDRDAVGALGTLSIADIADISEQTIPEDFRNRRIHKCWRIVRGSS